LEDIWEPETMAKNEKVDIDDACPFPPGVDIPRKSGLGSVLGSVLVVDWRVIAPILSLGVIIIISGLLISPPIPFTSPIDPKTWNSTIPEYNTSFFPELSGWVPKYPKQIVHQGDLTLEGEEKYLIENCTYILNGTFLAPGNSRLVLRNAELWVKPTDQWYSGGPFPRYGDMIFTNSSTLIMYNSSIVGPASGGVTFVLLEDSVADVRYSNVTLVKFNCDDRSRILVDHSTAGGVFVATNASCSIMNSGVDFLIPGNDHWTSILNFQWLGTRAKVVNSTLNSLAVRARGSKIEVNGSMTGETNWDPSTICSGGRWFNVSLLNSTMGRVMIWVENSTISIENSRDLNSLRVVNGSVSVANCSIPLLQVENCDTTLDDSVFGGILVIGDSEASIKSSLTEILSLSALTGNVECDRVMTTSVVGDHFNATLLGGLKILEHGVLEHNLLNYSRLKRVYQVFAEAGGTAMKDVSLTLRNGNDTIWSGNTDASGQASFNLTYYHLWRLGVGTWADDNMTSSFILSATSGDQQQFRNVTVESDTPMIFSFDEQPELPIWGNRYTLLMGGGLIIAATVGYAFSKRKGLRGDLK
jgi:hypothetical protein